MVYARRGLRESLEEFARANGVSVHDARHRWRALGLQRLFRDGVQYTPCGVRRDGPRIAPGLAVPTPNYPTEIEVSP